MARNIGATLSLKDGNFFTNIKSAATAADNFKNKITNATGSLKKHSSHCAITGNSLKTLAGKVVGVVSAYAGFHQIVKFGQECVTAADTQVRAEKRLEQLMMNVKGTTLENVAAMKQYASELQGITTVGDEAIIQGASQLATFQLQSNTIKTLLPSLQDLAVSQYGVTVSGEQMQSMANLMGKVMTGSVSALTRYGVTLNDNQKKILQTGNESQRAAMLVEVLNQNFGGLAQAMANTPEGKVVQIKQAWGDMQEIIGQKLYPIVTSFFGMVADKMPIIQNGLSAILDSGIVEKAANGIFDGISTIFDTAGNIIMFIKNNWGIIQPILKGVLAGILAYKSISGVASVIKGFSTAISGIGTVLTFVTSPIGLVVIAIGAVIAIGIALYKHWDTIKEYAGKLWNGIKNIFGGIKDTISNAWNGVKETASNVWGNIKDTVSEKLNNIKIAYEEHGGGIKGIAFAAMEGVKGYYTLGFDFINNITGGKLNAVKDKIKSVFDSIKDTVKNVMDSIKTKISDIWEGIKGIFKIPHIVQDGTVSIAGIDTPIPKFKLQWYADGGIMRRPTVFGLNGGNPMIGGEAGAEAILPLSQFWSKLGAFMQENRNDRSVRPIVNNYVTVHVPTENADDEQIANRIAVKVVEAIENM